MYTVPQYKPWVMLIGENGSKVKYDNYEQFIENTSAYFIKNNLVITFKDDILRGLSCFGFNDTKSVRYILRDQFDSVFSPTEVYHDIKKYEYKKYSKTYINRYNFIYRKTPIPNTGKKNNNWFGCYYKRPKTTQERRSSYEYKKYVRGRRRPCNLPNNYDDVQRGDISNRKCWKNKKKKRQWL